VSFFKDTDNSVYFIFDTTLDQYINEKAKDVICICFPEDEYVKVSLSALIRMKKVKVAEFLQDEDGFVYIIFDSIFKERYDIEENVNAFDLDKFSFVNLNSSATGKMKKVFLKPDGIVIPKDNQKKFSDMKKGEFFFWNGFTNIKIEKFHSCLSLQITALEPEEIILSLKMFQKKYYWRRKEYVLMKPMKFSERNIFLEK
jgi:hypothetical protein